jgi:hypothetical protein
MSENLRYDHMQGKHFVENGKFTVLANSLIGQQFVSERYEWKSPHDPTVPATT